MATDKGPAMCPTFHPSKEEFAQPFCKYIKKVLKKHPDIAMFKVVPPEGWKPRRWAVVGAAGVVGASTAHGGGRCA